MKKLALIPMAAVAALLVVTAALAASYTLFGDALIVTGGNPGNAAQIRSDATIPPGYGGVRFTVPAGTTFATLAVLSTDFKPEADDGCAVGSPRFQIRVPDVGPADTDATGDNIFVYIGPNPAAPPCVAGIWQNTGDLLSPGLFVDTSQLGGTFYHEYTAAVAAFGSLQVLRVSIVTDSGYAFLDAEQTILVDNVNINGSVETFDLPADKDACKDDGWQTVFRADGSSFKNQGDCIQFVNTGN